MMDAEREICNYASPDVEILEVEVESGFAASPWLETPKDDNTEIPVA